MAFTSDIRRLETGLGDRVQYVFDALRAQRVRRAAYRQTHEELSALTARELADLGISRSDIPAIAREASLQA